MWLGWSRVDSVGSGLVWLRVGLGWRVLRAAGRAGSGGLGGRTPLLGEKEGRGTGNPSRDLIHFSKK